MSVIIIVVASMRRHNTEIYWHFKISLGAAS